MNRTLRISLTSASLFLGALGTLVAAPAFAAPPMQPGQIVQPAPASHTRVRVRHTQTVAGDLLGDALGEVTLRPAQRAQIDAIKKEAGAKHAAVKKAKKALLEALASQVGTGKLDRAGIQQSIDEMMLATMEEAKAHRAALDKLHALLDKAQRAQLAAAIEARTAKTDDDKHPGREEMRRLTDVLKLTPEQRAKVAAFFKDQTKDDREHGAQAKAREHKMLEAFKGDKYDADKVVPPSAVRAQTQQEVSRLLAVVAHVLPVLTPEQRKVAADMLLDRANGSTSLKL
jgi:Spy/CpxP family protein refolding chaperone